MTYPRRGALQQLQDFAMALLEACQAILLPNSHLNHLFRLYPIYSNPLKHN